MPDSGHTPPCRTCKAEVEDIARRNGGEEIKLLPADYVAMAGPDLPWPVCKRHMPFAMVAGWFPIYDGDSDEARAALTVARKDQTNG